MAVAAAFVVVTVGLVAVASGGSAEGCERRYYSPTDAEHVLAQEGWPWQAGRHDALVAVDWCPGLERAWTYTHAQIAEKRDELLDLLADRSGADDVELGIAPDGTTVVSVPTWFWLDAEGLSGGWMRARSNVLPVRVELPTADLQLSDVAFDVGDGSSVSCEDGGVPYDPDTPYDDQDTDCSHVYERPAEDGTYEVHARATVTRPYRCRIDTGPGASFSCGNGDLDLPIDVGPVSLRVAEVQALVTGVRR